MAKHHGARQQKKAARQKAKRAEKRHSLSERASPDPTIRLSHSAKWPVVRSLVAADLWQRGLGSLAIARQEPDGGLVVAVFLVDVHCLGVKNALWHTMTPAGFEKLVEKLEVHDTMGAIAPECLTKIVQGAVAYARSFGFAPHPDYRHAAMLLEGIDPATCPQDFTFGRDGKPFYVKGPNESNAQAEAITRRIMSEGGQFLIGERISSFGAVAGIGIEDETEVDENNGLEDEFDDGFDEADHHGDPP
jgi:hypothetical protein